MQVVHNVKKHRLICQLLIYSRLHQCLGILDVYRKLVASIPFIMYAKKHFLNVMISNL